MYITKVALKKQSLSITYVTVRLLYAKLVS